MQLNIEELARKAGLQSAKNKQFREARSQSMTVSESDDWKKTCDFAQLVAAAVKEEAAKVCDDLDVPWSCNTLEKSLWDVATVSAADAIRAMEVKT